MQNLDRSAIFKKVLAVINQAEKLNETRGRYRRHQVSGCPVYKFDSLEVEIGFGAVEVRYGGAEIAIFGHEDNYRAVSDAIKAKQAEIVAKAANEFLTA